MIVTATTFADVIAGHGSGRPGRTAVVCGHDRLGWPELDDRVDSAVAMLTDAGVEPGDRVVWLAQNCHRYLELLLACARSGAVFCPLNWRMQVEEARFVLGDLAPRVVVWQRAELAPLVTALRSESTAPAALWIGHDDPGPDGYEARLAHAGPTNPTIELEGGLDPGRAVLLLYTAAFDGTPNGALLSSTCLLMQGFYGIHFGGVGPDDIYLNSGPLFHVGTLKATLATVLAGGTNVFLPRVDAQAMCEIISAERCTGAFLQRPTIDAMVELNRTGAYDLSSLRSKPGSPEWNAMVCVDHPAQRFQTGYGQTELGGAITFVDSDRPCIGSAGRPAPLTTVEIIDAVGFPAPPGEVGEIVVRGQSVMLGYHRRPELSALRRLGGWHHTNDLGRREADGSMSFIAPLTRIIKSAAENIYPAEVEICLRAHPDVQDAAVIGLPDELWGQRVLALVVAEDRRPTADDLIEHCRQRIASYKKPSAVIFVDSLPRNGAAIDYDALDAEHGGGGYPGVR